MTCGKLWHLVLGVLEEKTDPVPAKSLGTAAAMAAVSGADAKSPTEREMGAMETAVRTLIPLAGLYDQAGTDLSGLCLTEDSEFPLPPLFIPAFVYLTGYLLGGDTRLGKLYTDECENLRRSIPAEISDTRRTGRI